MLNALDVRCFVAILALLAARAVYAQCGAASTECRTCHDAQGAVTCDASEPWHRDHGFAELCAKCHGGDATARELGPAHAGLAWPLEEGGARCAECHPGTARRLAVRYASWRAANPRDLLAPPPSPRNDLPLAVIAALIGVAGTAYVVLNERRLR